MVKKCNQLWGVAVTFFFIFLVGNLLVQAFQPQLVEFKVQKFNKSGTVQPGTQPRGDDHVKVTLFPTKEEVKNWILVVFPEIGRDNRITGGPVWQMYADRNIILIPPGKDASFDVYVDFLRSEDGGVSPRLHGKTYVVDEKDVESMGKNPRLIAQLVHDQQPAAEVIIDLYYRIKDGRWVTGTFVEIFGAPSKDELEAPLTEDYD